MRLLDWLKKLIPTGGKAPADADKAKAGLSPSRRRLLYILIAFIALIPAAMGIRSWILSHQPDRLGVEFEAPGLTPFEENAKPDPLIINFSGSAANLNDIGKPINSGIRLTPAIKGSWRWESDSRIVFTPAEEWAVGQEYEFTMSESLFPDHVKLKAYEGEFSTEAFRANVTSAIFYQDPEDPDVKKVVGTVSFTHPVDTKDFEKRVKAKMRNKSKGLFGSDKELPFTVSYNKYFSEAYIHTGSIAIPEDDEVVVISIESGSRSSRGGPGSINSDSMSVNVPGMFNYFKISSASVTIVQNEKDEPEQVLIVESTGDVREEEMRANISAWLLPMDKPAIQGGNSKVIRNYNWHSTAEIGPEVLELSTPVELALIPGVRQQASIHSFRITVEEKRRLYVRITKGMKSFGGYVLAKEFDSIESVPEFKRELKIMHDGAILSLSGQRKLSMLSRDVEAVKFEVGRVMPGQINHLVSQTYGNFRDPHFSSHYFNQNNITDRFSEVLPLMALEHGKTQYFAFDFGKYLSPAGGANRGLFFFKVRGWDINNDRATGPEDDRFILVTDLGLVVKDNADGSHDVFVMSINSGNPVSGAKVEVLGLNGVPVVSSTTGADGHVRFKSLASLEKEKSPTVYVATHGLDISFMPYGRPDRQVNFSRFDVGGVFSEGKGDRLNAFLFSDRGIYRPGDTFHIGTIVKPTDWRQNINGVPLEEVIVDPRGIEISSRRILLNEMGFRESEFTTQENSPTGTYTVTLYIVKDNRRHSQLGATTVRVEEFLPDRMHISSRFSVDRQEGWVSPEGLKAYVTLMNLYGTPATDRTISADIELSPTYPSFRAYRDYTFFDPMRAEHSFSDRLDDVKTNAEGEAEFDLHLEKFERATYRLLFSAEGYEAEGGRAVLTQNAILVSPMKFLVGFKADGSLGYINKDSERNVEIIAVDPTLKKIAAEGLTATLMERTYVSVLKKQDNGTFKYQSEMRETEVESFSLSIPEAGYKYKVPSGRAGDFALVITDGKRNELNKIAFSIAGKGNLTRSLDRNAELQIKLDKSDYSAGEEIEVYIKAPYAGAGLITIEKDRVYASKWFHASVTGSVQRIRVPEGLEGNGYVNIAFVRSMDSDEIYMSPLSYGVVPFSVSLAKRDLGISLSVPELARPGEPLKIKYKSARSGKAVVYAVDEGILQVARYSTPSPIAFFFRKAALEVNTSQILDLILPEYAVVLRSSTSGDMDEAREALGKNLNPFKRKRDRPVAYWSGIVDIGPGERELVYNVPDYFSGKLRVMAVAVSSDSLGSAEKSLLVKGHFVLSPNVPTFAAPGDEFEVSVNVANNVEGSGPEAALTLELKTSEHLEVLDNAVRTMSVGENREKSESFRLRAANRLGSANFTFTASMGDKKSRISVDMSVRPATPYIARIKGGYMKGEVAGVQIDRKMHKEFRTLEVSASYLPLSLAKGLVNYLNAYPYGCTEQLVSKALPALILRNRPEFGYAPSNADALLEGTMAVLRSRQNAEGAFGLWAANSHVSDIISVYAMHFLTEAQESGYPVNQQMLHRGLNYMLTLAQQKPRSMNDARVSAYAIYILTRNGRLTTSQLTTLHTELNDNFKGYKWNEDLAALYMAASYKMLRIDDKANSLMRSIEPGVATMADYAYYYDGLVRESQLVYIITRHFQERMEDISGEQLKRLARYVSDGNFNTLNSSYLILALSSYSDVAGTVSSSDLKLTEVMKDGSQKPLVMPATKFPSAQFSDQTARIDISSRADLGIFYQVTLAGFDIDPPAGIIKDRIEVQREYRDENGNEVTKVKVGDQLSVHIKMRAIDDEAIGNVAVVDLLPGGFEVVLDSGVRQGEDRAFNSEYVDVREDRVIVFGSVTRDAGEYVYHIRATNKGNYATPPVFAEGMYERTVQARSVGAKMEVVGR